MRGSRLNGTGAPDSHALVAVRAMADFGVQFRVERCSSCEPAPALVAAVAFFAARHKAPCVL